MTAQPQSIDVFGRLKVTMIDIADTMLSRFAVSCSKGGRVLSYLV